MNCTGNMSGHQNVSRRHRHPDDLSRISKPTLKEITFNDPWENEEAIYAYLQRKFKNSAMPYVPPRMAKRPSIKRFPIHMVILDLIMPDMGGGAVYDRLKEINPDVKVLLSSGYSIGGAAQEILDRGCNDFIQKPFNLSRLSQKIRKLLDQE